MSERKAIPMVGFGTWTLRGDVARRAVSEALEVGYRHVDTAQMYENEGDVGAALAASGIAPADLYVVTKLWPDRFERRIAREETGRSLDRLRLDRVDLLLAHWPSPNVSVEDIVDQLAAVQGEGLCAAFGVSNFNNGMLARAVAQAPGRVATNQVEFNPLLDQRRLLGTARRLGVPLTAVLSAGARRGDAGPCGRVGRGANRPAGVAGRVALGGSAGRDRGADVDPAREHDLQSGSVVLRAFGCGRGRDLGGREGGRTDGRKSAPSRRLAGLRGRIGQTPPELRFGRRELTVETH